MHQKAVRLLSSVYDIRNCHAHNSSNIEILLENLREVLNSISSKDEMRQIMRLIIPHDYAANILNIYYLVNRESNDNYDALYNSLNNELYSGQTQPSERTISIVLSKYKLDYEEFVVKNCLLNLIKDSYMVVK